MDEQKKQKNQKNIWDKSQVYSSPLMLDDRSIEHGLASWLDYYKIQWDMEMFLLKRWILGTFCVHLQHSGEDTGGKWQVCVLPTEQHQSSELKFKVSWKL